MFELRPFRPGKRDPVQGPFYAFTRALILLGCDSVIGAIFKLQNETLIVYDGYEHKVRDQPEGGVVGPRDL